MRFKIENKYQDAAKFREPPCSPIAKDCFMELLSKGVSYVAPGNDPRRVRVYESHVRIARAYLDKYGIQEVVPDEAFFLAMWERLKVGGEAKGDLGEKKYSPATTQRAVRGIRDIVSRYFLAQDLISRPILLEVEWNRYQRFWSLTPQSQKAVVWFEENGRIVKSFPVMFFENGSATAVEDTPIRYVPKVIDKKLLPYTNTQKIQAALRFLEVVKTSGFELVTDEDVETYKAYLDKRNLKKKNDYLADIASFFINLKSGGFIKGNPFKDISLKKDASSVRIDYIPQSGIDRLYDLSNLDMTNSVEVRNRLMTFFCYDLALRIAEAASLKISDIQKDSDGEWCLLLKSESQKGREKPPVTMYLYFEKTKQLLEHYLGHIREKFRPRDESLFLSIHSGQGIKLQPCQSMISGHLAKFGIKTCFGKKATAHHLRHSFGTLNIEPLGLSLPAHEISYRYRHTRLEITMRIYVHNNPELVRLKHREIQKRHKRSYSDLLDTVPLAELEHWLSDRLRFEMDFVRTFRKKYREVFTGQKGSDNQNASAKIVAETVDSTRAREVAKQKGISFRFLKRYCRAENLLRKEGRACRFDASFIGDLGENWLPLKQAMEKLNIPERSLYRVIEEKKWPTLKIGNKLLIGASKMSLLQI